MRSFATLLKSLDQAGDDTEQSALLENYLRSTPPEDAAWAVHFLQGNSLKRAVTLSHLREWVQEFTQLPAWLIEECQTAVGDWLETISLLLPSSEAQDRPPRLSEFVQHQCLPMRGLPSSEQRQRVLKLWTELAPPERALGNTLLSGRGIRDLPWRHLIRALSNQAQIAPYIMAQRLALFTSPEPESFTSLFAPPSDIETALKPLPLHPVGPRTQSLDAAVSSETWIAEWNRKGMRAQVIRRAGACALWSHDEDLITPALPELTRSAGLLPEGTVLDGVICAIAKNHSLPPLDWQETLRPAARSGASSASRSYRFMAHDCLECAGEDLRHLPLRERRARLSALLKHSGSSQALASRAQASPQWIQGDLFASAETTPPLPPVPVDEALIQLSPSLPFHDAESLHRLRNDARSHGARGLILKRSDEAYGDAEGTTAWIPWNLEPLTCFAVLLGVQPGDNAQGRGQPEWQLAVRRGKEWVQIATVAPALPEEELKAIDAFVQENIIARFGPSRRVKPELVFEIAFDGIHPSTRHKAGLILEAPRVVCWHRDKSHDDVDTVESLAQRGA